VLAYTENDSFRSRQIRENLMQREKAIALTKQENKLRYETLKWYFDSLNLDGDYVLKEIENKIIRKYELSKK
jgi:hypothetical protein